MFITKVEARLKRDEEKIKHQSNQSIEIRDLRRSLKSARKNIAHRSNQATEIRNLKRDLKAAQEHQDKANKRLKQSHNCKSCSTCGRHPIVINTRGNLK